VANGTIDLTGSYERHNDEPTYSFTTLQNQFYQFFMRSQVMNYVQIVKARFNTNKKPGSGNTQDERQDINSTFSFWGYINFVQLDGFDAFSFGDAVPTRGSVNTGLYFYNLAVLMNFALVKSSDRPPKYSVENRNFRFSEEQTSFDTSLSTVHNNSLYPNFPLTITSLISSKAGTLDNLGFVPVDLPAAAAFNELGENWYALVCTLNLGSMGALASLAGFTARLVIAWSESTDAPAVTVGISLPGTGASKSFSFQNVLTLSTDAFVFDTDTTSQPGQTIYSLLLRSIGLSLLGKRFPPGGTTNVILYGNPQSPGKIGWYGQYYNG